MWKKIKEQEQKQGNHLEGVAIVRDGRDGGLHSSATMERAC